MRKLARFALCTAAVALALGTVASVANANAYTGVAYCNVSTSVSMNTPTTATLSAGEATGTECATFSATAIDFSGDAAGKYNLGGFLTSNGAAFGISYWNGFNSSSSMNNSLWVFSGVASFVNGETFTVTHDDGTEMYVNGINVLSVPGPTAPVNSTFTYNGGTGNYGFEFIFTECCGGSVDYKTSLAPPVSGSATPEPGTILLLGTGLLGFLGMAKRRLLG